MSGPVRAFSFIPSLEDAFEGRENSNKKRLGLAGYGCNRKIHSRRLGNLYLCGDESSQCPRGISPMAPRVALVAAMQANLVVELLVKMKGRRPR